MTIDILCPASATRTSLQGSDDRVGQPPAHGCDRIWNVAFRPQGRILWVDNRRERQVAGRERSSEVLRGESSPVRRSGIRKPRRRAWSDDGSRASRVPQSDRARPPASAPDNRARCASAIWRDRPDGRSQYSPAELKANTLSAPLLPSAIRSKAILPAKVRCG